MVWYRRYLYPLVICYITMENHHLVRESSHETWWIFPVRDVKVDQAGYFLSVKWWAFFSHWDDPLLWGRHGGHWATSKRSKKLHNRMTWAGHSSLIHINTMKSFKLNLPWNPKFRKKNNIKTSSSWGVQECLQSTAGGRCPAAPTTAAREGGSASSAIGSSYGSPFWAGWGLVMWTLVYKAHE